MNIDHKIKTKNKWEEEVVKAIEVGAQILANHLKLHNITLRVERQSGWGRSDAFHAGKWLEYNTTKDFKIEKVNMVKINLRNLQGASIRDIMTIVGHEFRHAMQSINNLCDTVADCSTNKPSHIKLTYWNDPIEKDARKYQDIYANIILNHTSFIFSNTTHQNPLFIEDYELTYQKYSTNKNDCKLWKKSNGKIYFIKIQDLNNLTSSKFSKWTKKASQTFRKLKNNVQIMQEWDPVLRELNIYDLIS